MSSNRVELLNAGFKTFNEAHEVDSAIGYFVDRDGSTVFAFHEVTDQHVMNGLIEGRAVVISGLRKDGTSFSCCAQFDAAQRQVVPCHPKWFQEATRAGMDIGRSHGQSKDQGKESSQKAEQEQSRKSQGKSSGMRK